MTFARTALALALALVFALGALAEAVPETREATISLEGMDETITLTRFDSEWGYRLWFDAAMFIYAPDDAQPGADVFRPANPDAVPGVSFFIRGLDGADASFGAARQQALADLQEKGYAVTEVDAAALFPQYEAAGYHGIRDSMILETYIAASGQDVFELSLSYPLIAAEGFGARMWYMAGTLEILEQQQAGRAPRGLP